MGLFYRWIFENCEQNLLKDNFTWINRPPKGSSHWNVKHRLLIEYKLRECKDISHIFKTVMTWTQVLNFKFWWMGAKLWLQHEQIRIWKVILDSYVGKTESLWIISDKYVIRKPGGPYWEKLYPVPTSSGGTQDLRHSFSPYDPTKAGE